MLYIKLDKENRRTYTKQIYTQLRGKILRGELKGGESFPSTRELSAELQVSRNTVMSAIDMLVSEGLAYSIPGSGVYVSQSAGSFPSVSAPFTDYSAVSLSEELLTPDVISFDSGIPALELFPRKSWSRFVSRALMDAPVSALGYDDPQGRPELRHVLAAYLRKTRGIDCHPDQIIITSGVKQGLTLIAKCLLDKSSEVLVEDPSNANVRQILSYHTERIIPVPVDNEGIITELLPRDAKPKLIFVTPSHQFPMGGILSMRRRLELVEFAKRSGSYIIEDDYDSEFQFDGATVHSLYELDRERVVYVGTFSKVMFPSMRLGYMVLPYPLVSSCREFKRLADHHSNSIYQLALKEFIEEGELERHIRHMKKIYLARRNTLLEQLGRAFPDGHIIYGKAAGMHLVAGFDGGRFDSGVAELALERGLYIVPVEKHCLEKGAHLNQVILGYAHLDAESMQRGLAILKNMIQ